MIRAGRAVVAAVVGVGLFVGATACGGAAQNSSSTQIVDPNDVVLDTVEPAPTLGLTPIKRSSTVPLTTLDTLPGADGEEQPTTTTTLAAETTVAAPTSLDPVDLPAPEPAPIPDAHEEKNQIGFLEIPALSVSQNLYEGVTLKTLDNGPGHWPGTAMPGQTGNVVIAGHRVSRTHPFRDIDKLKKGDEVVFSTAQGRNVYVVTKIQIVNPDALWIIEQTREKTATLFACHPKGSTAQRIVAFLKYAPEKSKPAA